MPRTIELTRSEPYLVTFDYATSWRIRIDAAAVEGSGADPHVFLWLMGETDPITNTRVITYQSVCGPTEMADYDPDEPRPDRAYKFLRLNYCELELPAIGLAQETWDHVRSEVDRLCYALEKLGILRVIEVVEVGPEQASSSSASGSASSGG